MGDKGNSLREISDLRSIKRRAAENAKPRKVFQKQTWLLKTALLEEVDFDEERKKKARFLFSASLQISLVCFLSDCLCVL